LYASLPEEIRDVTPLNLECHLRRKRTISLAA
jgi:hypothetical protein